MQQKLIQQQINQQNSNNIVQSSTNLKQNTTPLQKQSSSSSSKQLQAYTYGIISFISIVLMQLNVKTLCRYFPAFLILGIRNSGMAIIFFTILYFRGVSLNIQDPLIFKLVIKRAIASALAMTIYMSSVQFIPIGIAATLFNTGPLFTFFTQALYFKKFTIKWVHVFITFLCFCGIVLIIQPQFLFKDQNVEVPFIHYIVYGMVILGAFISTFSMIITHDLRKAADQYVILGISSIFHYNCNYLLYLLFKDSFTEYPSNNALPSDAKQIANFIIVMLIFIVLAYITQYTRTKSALLIIPSKIMPFQYISVVFGMLLDIFIFEAQYNIYMILGAILTSCGLLTKVLVEHQAKNT